MSAPPEDLVILADQREVPSGVPALLASDSLFEVRVEYLPCGDYLVSDLAIERKTVDDFRASIDDGRLFKQLLLLRRMYRRRCLLIEGTDLKSLKSDRRCESLLIKISTGLQIPVLWSGSPEHTARLIRRAAIQLFKLSVTSPVIRIPQRSEDLQFQQRYLLLGFPMVGLKRANALLQAFGSVANIIAASAQELAAVEGIGLRCAERIRNLIDSSYPAELPP